MKVDNLKDLEKLIKLCRKTGIHSIKVDGMEFELGALPDRPRLTRLDDPMAGVSIPAPNILDPIAAAKAHAAAELKKVQDYIQTDEPTEDQMLMWSARAEVGHEQ